MDYSNFDTIELEDGFIHILITEGFKTEKEAVKEIKKIIQGKSFYNKGNPDFERQNSASKQQKERKN